MEDNILVIGFKVNNMGRAHILTGMGVKL